MGETGSRQKVGRSATLSHRVINYRYTPSLSKRQLYLIKIAVTSLSPLKPGSYSNMFRTVKNIMSLRFEPSHFKT